MIRRATWRLSLVLALSLAACGLRSTVAEGSGGGCSAAGDAAALAIAAVVLAVAHGKDRRRHPQR